MDGGYEKEKERASKDANTDIKRLKDKTRRDGGKKKGGRKGGREGAYLIHRPNLRREPTMHTQHLPVNQRGKVKVIEDVDAVLPGVGVPVLAHAFLVESVDLPEGGREGGRENGLE